MNIALLHYAAPPIVGGVESVMAQHARLMARDGHDVCLVAGRGGQIDERTGFRQVPLLNSRDAEVLALKAELDRGRVPPAFEALAQRIQGELQPILDDADVVIPHNVCSLNKNLALTAALHRMSQRGGARYILWHHDLAWTTPRYRAELHEGYPWDLLRNDWPWVEQVVVSKPRRQELAELMRVPLDRIHVVSNGLDVGQFLKLSAETEALLDRLHLATAAPLMLLPVRITTRKNIELGLRVVAELRKQFENARLLVTGPLGPHNPANKAYFERLLALRAELRLDGAAHFLAEVVDHGIPDEVIADLYKLADLLFLPSREEGFGIPVLEAGLAGIPVFCSDIAALRELAAGEAHYFSAGGDPARIAGQIAEVLQKSEIFRLKKRVLGEYTWDRIYRNSIAPLLAKG